MKAVHFARAHFGLIALLAFGCGRDTLSAGLTIEQFAYDEANFHCKTVQSCCNASGFAYDFLACVDTDTALNRTWFQPGPLEVYDPLMAERCAENLLRADTTCGAHETFDDCGAVFKGILPPGASCGSDDGCAAPYGGGAMCVGLPSAGRCVSWERGKLGEACDGDVEVNRLGDMQFGWPSGVAQVKLCFSSDNLYCSHETGTCTTRGASGTKCSVDAPCAAQYYCEGAGHSCRPKATVGQACDDATLPCENSAFCDSLLHSCLPKKADGAECTRDVECPRLCIPQDSGISICRQSGFSQDYCATMT